MPAFGLNVRAAFVVIAASTAILWTLLVLGIRILLRLKINGPFGRDDYACITGTVSMLTPLSAKPSLNDL